MRQDAISLFLDALNKDPYLLARNKQIAAFRAAVLQVIEEHEEARALAEQEPPFDA